MAEEKIAGFYSHFSSYIFNLTDPKKNYHTLNYWVRFPGNTIKSHGIENKYNKYSVGVLIDLNSTEGKVIRGIEDYVENRILTEDTFAGYTFKRSLYLGKDKEPKTGLMYLKVPYRYKKFECEFICTNGQHTTSDSIKKGDKVDIQVKVANLWIFHKNKQIGLSWQARRIDVV